MAADDAFLTNKVTVDGRYAFSMRDCDFLGAGARAEVFRCTERAGDGAQSSSRHTRLAIKVYKRGCAATGEEIGAAKRMEPHENVAAVLASSVWLDVHGKPRDVMVSEAFDADLYSVMESNEGVMAEASAASVLHQMLSGLAHMHSAGVVHHDVKPENVYVDLRSGRVVVGDFDLCTFFTPGAPGLFTEPVPCVKRGTLDYLPPELRLGTRGQFVVFDGRKGDVWAAGVTALFLLTRTCMTVHTGNVVFQSRDALNALSPQAVDFLESALCRDVARRPTADVLLQHPWLGCRRMGAFMFNRKSSVAAASDAVIPAKSCCGGGIVRVFLRRSSRVRPSGTSKPRSSGAVVPLIINMPQAGQKLGSNATAVSTPMRTGVLTHKDTAVTLIASSPVPSPLHSTAVAKPYAAGNAVGEPSPPTDRDSGVETIFS